MTNISKFSNRVYNAVKKIPRGKVLTYRQVAQKLGDKNLARAVGNALNKNRDAAPRGRRFYGVPCHRVVRADGRVGGFNRGNAVKIKLLKSEGVKIKNRKIMNDK